MSLSGQGKWYSNFSAPENPMQNLALISSQQNPVRVEIEQTLIQFDAHIMLRHADWIVVSKPDRIEGAIRPGAYIRLRILNAEMGDLRLQVVMPDYNVANSQPAFVCRLTRDFQACRRRNERYRTLQYKNLRLRVGSNPHRLADISAAGLKFLVADPGGSGTFPLELEMLPATLIVGSGVSIELKSLIPRSHHQSAVGCEIKVAENRDSQTYFGHLMDLMEQMSFTPSYV